MKKKDGIRKSERYVSYDPDGKKHIRVISYGKKVKNNEPYVEHPAIKKLFRKGNDNLEDYFPAFPFRRSGLERADGCLHYSPECKESLEKKFGLHPPLTKKELAVIDKTVGSREISDIKCFLIQECNVQNVVGLNWDEILEHLRYYQRSSRETRKKRGHDILNNEVEDYLKTSKYAPGIAGQTIANYINVKDAGKYKAEKRQGVEGTKAYQKYLRQQQEQGKRCKKNKHKKKII